MTGLVLKRQQFDEHATLGKLSKGDEFQCWTLENRPPKVPGVKEPGLSRIPAGTWPLAPYPYGQKFYERYTAKWDWHGPMVEIQLPGWKAVLFHVGNYHKDTDGCVLVGKSHGTWDKDGSLTVWSSTSAYKAVYPALLSAAEAGETLTVIDEA